jgi:hypothetical protein
MMDNQAALEAQPHPTQDAEEAMRFCSFCGRPQTNVAVLIAGSGSTYICEFCVSECVRIIVDRHRIKCGIDKGAR